jgi:hypothetical protein
LSGLHFRFLNTDEIRILLGKEIAEALVKTRAKAVYVP